METESRQEKLEKLRKFWKTHLETWEESGLPQKEYCRQHNLVYHRFGYWDRNGFCIWQKRLEKDRSAMPQPL